MKPFTARATIWNSLADQATWSWEHWDCQGKWVREICIFGIGDLPWLSRRPELFINKLYTDFEWLTYDCLEERVFNRTIGEGAVLPLDMTYYLRLPFVINRSLVTTVNETIQFLRRRDE